MTDIPEADQIEGRRKFDLANATLEDLNLPDGYDFWLDAPEEQGFQPYDHPNDLRWLWWLSDRQSGGQPICFFGSFEGEQSQDGSFVELAFCTQEPVLLWIDRAQHSILASCAAHETACRPPSPKSPDDSTWELLILEGCPAEVARAVQAYAGTIATAVESGAADPQGTARLPGRTACDQSGSGEDPDSIHDQVAAHREQRPINAGHHIGCMVDGCSDMPVLMWVDTFAPWQVILCASHATDLPLDDEWIIGNLICFDDCPSMLRQAAEVRAEELSAVRSVVQDGAC